MKVLFFLLNIFYILKKASSQHGQKTYKEIELEDYVILFILASKTY